MITARTVVVLDPFARANVVETLGGAGAPSGVIACVEEGSTVVVTFDAQRTQPELIDALLAIASTFTPERAPRISDIAVAAALAASGLNDPELDASRVIETYLP